MDSRSRLSTGRRADVRSVGRRRTWGRVASASRPQAVHGPPAGGRWTGRLSTRVRVSQGNSSPITPLKTDHRERKQSFLLNQRVIGGGPLTEHMFLSIDGQY